jgi:aspartyl/asparaginyl beta-hydroxylase (cupin superfamily)
MQTFADILAILVAFLLTAVLFVHYRGRVRLKFLRQVTDHSTFTAPYNALVYLFSKVPTRPFLPASDFPDLAPLNEAWATVREEGLKLAREDKVRTATADNDLGFHTIPSSSAVGRGSICAGTARRRRRLCVNVPRPSRS